VYQNPREIIPDRMWEGSLAAVDDFLLVTGTSPFSEFPECAASLRLGLTVLLK